MTSRKITRTRHRCDHCGKGLWTRPGMLRHEAGCTLNPERVCAAHRFATGGEQSRSMGEIIAMAKAGESIALHRAIGSCPPCILALIRQWPEGEIETLLGLRAPFDFLAERKAMWDRYNNSEAGRNRREYGI